MLRPAANTLAAAVAAADRRSPSTRHGEIVIVRALAAAERPALAAPLERACARASVRRASCSPSA